jgi:hypothetical protein
MRNAAKQPFIREIVLVHDLSTPTDAWGTPLNEWEEAPKVSGFGFRVSGFGFRV